MIPSRPRLILLSLLLLSISNAHALQVLEARDGQTVMGKVSLREQTRIKAERGRINEVIGDVYDRATNPAGRVTLALDAASGEVYIRLADAANSRPVNLFVKTDKATVGLLLQPVDMPLETIMLRDRGLPAPDADAATASQQTVSSERMPHSTAYLRSIKALCVAMAGDVVPAEVEVRTAARELQLWKEARFTLERLYVASALVGERYRLRNISAVPMVLAEQEFYRDNVRAVAIEQRELRAGQSTSVFIVRDRTDSD